MLSGKYNGTSEKHLRNFLEKLSSVYQYYNISLVTTNGEILLSLKNNIKINPTVFPFIIKSVERKEIIFTNFYRNIDTNEIHCQIIAPIFSSGKKVVALLVLSIDLNRFLFPLIQSWPTPSKTSETLIIRKDGDDVLFLNSLRFRKNAVLNLRIPLTNKKVPAVQAVSGYKGIWEGIDYRDHDVLSYISPIQDTPWFMISKIDKSEIYGELYIREIIIIISTLILILLITVGLYWFYHYRQRNIFKNLYEVEKQFHAIEKEFRTTLYSIGDAVITTDKAGIVKYMNKVAEDLTGWKESEASGEDLGKVFNIISEDTRIECKSPVNKVIENGLIVGLANHTMLISKQGREIPIADSGAPIKNESDEIIGVVLVFRDQVKERATQKMIVDNMNKYRNLFNSIRDSILVADGNRKIVDFNPAFVELFGFGANDLLGKDTSIVYESKEEFIEMGKKIKENIGNPNFVNTINYKKKNGDVFPGETTAFFLKDKNGETVGVIGLIRDITERRAAENKLLHLNRIYSFQSNINQAIVRIRDLNELLNDVCLIAIEEGKFQSAFAGIYNSNFDGIKIFSKAGELNKKLDDFELELFVHPGNQNRIITSINSGKLYISNDISIDTEINPEWKDNFISLGFNSFAILPLKTAEKVSGFFCVFSNEKNIYDDSEISILTEAINDISFALEFINKEYEIKKQRDELQNYFENDISADYVTTVDGKILDANRTFLEMFGIPDKKSLGNYNLTDFYKDPRERAIMLEELRKNKIVKNFRTDFKKLNNEVINTLLMTVGDFNESGELIKTRGYVVDITKQIKSEEKLLESEKFLLETQKIAKLGTYKMDIKENRWESSELLDDIFGIDADYDKSAEGWKNIIHPEWQEEMYNYLLTEVFGKKNKFDKQYKIIRLNDNEERWVHGLGELIFDENDIPIMMIGTIKDITEQKLAELEINRLNRVYAVLSNINQAIVRIKDENILFAEICRIAVEYGKFKLAWAGRVNYETNIVEVVASAGDTEKYLDEVIIDLNDKKTGQGPTGSAIKMGKHMIVNDIKNDESMLPWRDRELSLGYRSTAAFPIKIENKIVGSMTLCSGQKHFFKEKEIELLDEMAMDISFALEYIKVEEESGKVLGELKKLSTAVEQGPASVMITDPYGNIEYVNKKFSNISEYTFEEVKGKKPNILKSGFQDEKFYENLWQTILEGKEWKGDLQNKKKSGELFWESVLISPLVNSQGDITHFVAIKEDITEKKLNEESLKLFRSLVNQTSDTIEILDPVTGQFINCNDKAFQSLGYTREEFLSMKVMDIDPNITMDSFAEMLTKFSDSESVLIESIHRRKDGTEFPVELNMQFVKLVREYIIVVGRDITKRKIEKEELIKAKELAEQSNKLKDAFIANMSHEIRTPLNGILGLAGIIWESYYDVIKPDDRELFDGIDSSSKRIIRTVDMILNYSRLQVGEYFVDLQEVDLLELCNALIIEHKSSANYKSLQLSVENNCGACIIKTDNYSVTHVISNLLDNAIKYTKKGFVKVIIHKNKQDEILLSIQDSGIGIGDEYLKHMFEPYRQEQMGYGRAYEGVGLGLSLVKKLLEHINATIKVESEKDKGTTFTINFGKQAKLASVKDVPVKVHNKRVEHKNTEEKVLLLVEDDEINQLTIKKGIEKEYKVLVADSAAGAIKILESNKVDLILMDISIRGELNGLEFTKELKNADKYKHIPVIVVSAHASESDITNSVNAGSNDFLSKPFSMQELLEKIKKNLI